MNILLLDAVKSSKGEHVTDLPGGAFTEWGEREWPCCQCGERYALAFEHGYFVLDRDWIVQRHYDLIIEQVKRECSQAHPTAHFRSNGQRAWKVE